MNNKLQWPFSIVMLVIGLTQVILFDNYLFLIALAIGFVLLFFVDRYEKYRRAKYVEEMER